MALWAALGGAAVPAWASSPFAGDYDFADSLLGGAGGVREGWRQSGVGLYGNYSAEMASNVSGGRSTGSAYAYNLNLHLELDLDRLVGWRDSVFRAKFSNRAGASASANYIGNVFTVQELYGGQTWKVVNFQVVNRFLDDRAELAWGRLVANDDFLRSPLYCDFINNAFCGSPVSVFYNVPDGYTAYPLATWGARLRYEIVPGWTLLAGVYDGDPTLGARNNHGTDWAFGDNGTLWAGEIQYAHGESLPGSVKLGGFYHSGDFNDLYADVNGGDVLASGLPARRHQGNRGGYLLVDQMLYREKAGSDEGLWGFAVAVGGADRDIQRMPWFYEVGLSYTGLFPGRPKDRTALGVAGGRMSGTLADAQRDAGLPVQGGETVIELNHRFVLGRGVSFQPDLQYIVNPGAAGQWSDATVVGFRLSLDL